MKRQIIFGTMLSAALAVGVGAQQPPSTPSPQTPSTPSSGSSSIRRYPPCLLPHQLRPPRLHLHLRPRQCSKSWKARRWRG